MTRKLTALLAALAVAGCYAHQAIPLSSVAELSAAPGRPTEAQVPGEDCGGCRVSVDATTPLLLTTADGEVHRVTPFYFHVSDTQIVSPDYGVLVERADVQRAEVRELSTGGTLALVGVVAAAAVGTFLAIQLTAGQEDLRAR